MIIEDCRESIVKF